MTSDNGGILMIEEAGTPNKFIVLRQEVLEDKHLTVAEKIVYARICTFDTYFESAETCARMLGLSKRQVEDSKRKLEKLGYIECLCNTGRGKQFKVKYDLQKNVGQTYENPYIRPTKKCKSDLRKNVGIDKRLEENIEENIEIRKKERKKETQTYDKIIEENVEDEKLRELLIEHLKLFALNRWAKLTNKGLEEKIKGLMDIAGGDVEIAKSIVAQSLANGWRGFFPPKTTAMVAIDQPYEAKDGENTEWKHILDIWGRTLGQRPQETTKNVEAIKKLLDEYGEDNTLRMVGALAMRSKNSKYLTKEIKGVSTPAELYENRNHIWNYYQTNAETWARRVDNNGRKPWQL